MTNTQMFDRKSAAKTPHKPCKGFEYRYILYIDHKVYDKYTKTLVKECNGKVELIGINAKKYNIPVQKLIDQTFCKLDLTQFDDVKEHPGYKINKNGALFNTSSGKYVSTTIKHGYMRYNVNWTRRMVHEVLADQYIPNPNNYETIDHVDCNKLNNALSNLEWVTQEENKRRAYVNGLTCVFKSLVTFSNGKDTFAILGLEDAGKMFGISRSRMCTMIQQYGNKDMVIPSGALKGYMISSEKCRCTVQRLSEKEQDSSESEMVDSVQEKIQSGLQ